MNFRLSVIIPVYNEAKTIISVLEKVKKTNFDKEIIIINDGSTDDSETLIKEWTQENKDARFISYKKNMGKGYAIREGFKNISGDFVIIQDADLEYNPGDYELLLKNILKNNTGVVYGTRYKSWRSIFFPKVKFYHFLGNRLITLIANIIYKSKLTDIMTCYKVFRASVIKNLDLQCNGFAIEAEITAEVLKKRLKIEEVPISYAPRNYKKGKKINYFTDFFRIVYWLFKKTPIKNEKNIST